MRLVDSGFMWSCKTPAISIGLHPRDRYIQPSWGRVATAAYALREVSAALSQGAFVRFHSMTESNLGAAFSSAPSSSPQDPQLLLAATEEKRHMRSPPKSRQAFRYFV